MDFKKFSKQVNTKWEQLKKNGKIFTVNLDKDSLFDAYLAAFPEGTDPIFQERSTHNCNCCKQFIRNIGSTVAIVNGKLDSVWNIKDADYPYDVVAKALHDKLMAELPNAIFRTNQRDFGKETLGGYQDANGRQINWNHFHGTITGVLHSHKPGETIGQFNGKLTVLTGGVQKLSIEAVDIVLELINADNLYRGAEHKTSLVNFKNLLKSYGKMKTDTDRAIWLMESTDLPGALFKNTVIGTLVEDISKGVQLEDAVRMFESKVAPANYRRPKALVTPKMVEEATKTLEKLDLTDSIHRRHAKLSDVTINNVLWADSSAKAVMEGSLEDLLGSAVKTTVKTDNALKIGIEEFIKDVMPTAKSMDVMLKRNHVPNLMSITAPKFDTKNLFKWDNGFAWTYNGDVTDRIVERVKAAGGAINGKLRVSMSWDNRDDLDLHCYLPNKDHIYYGARKCVLDVDANGMNGIRPDPVENMNFTSLVDGKYVFKVDQYNKRDSGNQGYTLQVAYNGNVLEFNHAVNQSMADALVITVKNGEVTKVEANSRLNGGSSTTVQEEFWGVTTNTPVRVKTMMLSPNHWDGKQIGNKHYFFILENCHNPEMARGLYNEYLHEELAQHGRVFELLGEKTKIEPVTDQLSGVGFSSTLRNTVTLLVNTGKSKRAYEVSF